MSNLEITKFKNNSLYDPSFERDSCGVGFVCNINGEKSNDIVSKGLEVLKNLSHRGATGADPNTGDGAGLLIQIPHGFFYQVAKQNKIELPFEQEYGTGLVFLPKDPKEQSFCRDVFNKVIQQEGQRILGWRKVPIDNSKIGDIAKKTEPEIEQVFILKSKNLTEADFERKLYIIRRIIENKISYSDINQKTFFHITNLSCRTFAYKGLLMPRQLKEFFLDLKDERLESAMCLVHSRYSTNTFPTWDLAQPFRYLAHNGEINTLRGNINWMRAKENLLKSKYFGADIEKIKPIVMSGGSDSAMLDNVFELLVQSGRSIEHVMMMLIPSAWEHDKYMNDNLRAFYKYHTCLMEPWDGPAAVAFTDGTRIGAVLDRNGLRPARYLVTKQNLVVMASEVGVLDIQPQDILYSGRIQPGKMFYIDTEEKRIINNDELKEKIASAKPYNEWLKKNILGLDELPNQKIEKNQRDILTEMKAFGYTREDLKMIISPMAEKSQEPVGSMGNDTPHAVLSKKPQLLFNYFKQLFAQVTNPAIDPIREELVMSLECYMGPRGNILEETDELCRKLVLKHPILTNEQLLKIKNINQKGFKTKTIPILFKANDKKDFYSTLDKICIQAESAIRNKYTFIILSDRGANSEYAALPSLLATGAVHQYLVKKSIRAQIALIIESAEPREVHHFALLFGYGAGCVNPYLAYDVIEYQIDQGLIKLDKQTALSNYIKAVNKGILKVLSKMGISTLQSYRGAQIFEALGLNKEVINRCFKGTISRIEGAGLDVIAEETIMRHKDAYSTSKNQYHNLNTGGFYQWRKNEEHHLWNPDTISTLQDAVRKNDIEKYKRFAGLINEQSNNPTTLRSLFDFKYPKTCISIDEVEPVSSIFRRFATGAMSFGSISAGTHETIAIAMNRLKGRSNTGEGGEDPARFVRLPNGDSRRSAIKQVASGRFGVTTNYLVNADEIQIKIAQGAKPGEGGQLPGHKVSAIIARTRYTTQGVTLISPPPHHDIYSIEDLAQLIFDLKNVNPNARISVKLVSEIGVGTIAAGVAKGFADMILISGGDGGTGASPLSSIKHAGLPWELGVSETQQTLVLNDLRSRVRLQTDGQMRTGRDVAIAALLGAEEYGFCSAILIVLGCVMLRHCHLNNCSLGIATQDDILSKRFSGKPEYIINYFNFIAQELREIMAKLGFRRVDEMIGRSDLIKCKNENFPWKAKSLDFSKLLYKPDIKDNIETKNTITQKHKIDNVLDRELILISKPALKNLDNITIERKIKNINRSTGAMLSGEICKNYSESGLIDDTIHCKFYGVAGQSFGAFLAKGIKFELEGMANDYVGKGISGGKIIIYPYKKSDYDPKDNVIIGNTTFYGAISGEAYILGCAGERFCIRNSGLNAVVEGIGDHGCEYMTGGRVVILGRTGRNFAAGMSGGIAYVFDEKAEFSNKCNMGMVSLEKLDENDISTIGNLIKNHYKYTNSSRAKEILNNFKNYVNKFVKVIPVEYKRILESKQIQEDLELTEYSDG